MIDDLKRKAEAATPGKWRVNTAGHGNASGFVVDEVFVYAPECGVDDVAIAADIADPLTGTPSEANAAYIAACDPQTILALCAVVEAAPYAVEVIEMLMFYLKPGTSDCEHATKAANALRLALQGVQR